MSKIYAQFESLDNNYCKTKVVEIINDFYIYTSYFII